MTKITKATLRGMNYVVVDGHGYAVAAFPAYRPATSFAVTNHHPMVFDVQRQQACYDGNKSEDRETALHWHKVYAAQAA